MSLRSDSCTTSDNQLGLPIKLFMIYWADVFVGYFDHSLVAQ